ncbi:hypothetical protein L484_003840 [Morus notabilis]|uniref:Purine permease 10 n=1 Tax=Morus notabilis TaxID=981085 RepID=W9QWX5_9ROSA|nr:hypothetical protein L484_003840 [Morus notabilis]
MKEFGQRRNEEDQNFSFRKEPNISDTILLVFSTNLANPNLISKERYTIGLVCTVGSTAGYGLMLSLSQFAFEKVLKTDTFKAVLEMIIYQSLVATCVAMLGLFLSEEWKDLKREMEGFEPGMASYFITLGSTVMAWQIFTIGTTGLIFEVSSLFSNVISVLGLPFVSLLAVIFFHDAMDGLKAAAILLALWGFASYLYQHYLDDPNCNAETIILLKINVSKKFH